MGYIKKINGYLIKDEGAREAAAVALNRANDAYTLAEGKDVAVVYDNFKALETDLLNLEKGALKIGTQLLIKAKSVPDYWVSGTVSTPTTEATGSGDRDKSECYEEYTIGYYTISILETAKVDLTGYAKSSDLSGFATKEEIQGLTSDKITLSVVGEELQILKDGVMINPTYSSGGSDSGSSGGSDSGSSGGSDSGSSGGDSSVYADLNEYGQACSLVSGAKGGDIVIPYEAEGVAEYGFENCVALKSVTFIKGEVPTIGIGAFNGCTQLHTIRFNCTYNDFMDVYGSNMEESWLVSLSDDVTIVFYDSETTVESITKGELFS